MGKNKWLELSALLEEGERMAEGPLEVAVVGEPLPVAPPDRPGLLRLDGVLGQLFVVPVELAVGVVGDDVDGDPVVVQRLPAPRVGDLRPGLRPAPGVEAVLLGD